SLLTVNHGLATLAFVGVEVNLVLFATRVLNQTNAEAANTFSRWMGTVHLFSLMGAFLSDAYLGRYTTCVIFQFVFAIGLAMLSMTTSFLLLKPHGCGKLGFLCDSHSPFEITMFYLSIYLIALGNGAYEPSLATFGSDQFDEQNSQENSSNQSFYSYFYVATNLGSLISETVLAYIQNLGDWSLGFWVSTASAGTAFLMFLSGTMRYRRFKASGNPISRFFQVVVAAWRKSTVEIPLHDDGLFEVHGTTTTTHGARKILHTKGFRFLDHAAVITAKDRIDDPKPNNSWCLCTVTQVEEVKSVLRLLPVWLCTLTFSGIFLQMYSLFLEQGAAMKTTVNKFHIPPASMTVFDIVSVSFFIIFYDKLIVPLYAKLTNLAPTAPSDLKKMGIGLMIASIAMVTAGIIELKRKHHCTKEVEEMSSLSLLWQIPQYVLIGAAEAFVYVGQYDFFGTEAPDGLKSLGIGLCMASTSIGSYLCSLILTLVMVITAKGGRKGWIPSDLNHGHLERFFFLMAGLTLVELAVFIWFARRYNRISLERKEGQLIETE
ncbi:Protein NRT1/ PTR FAMILY 7.3, partial [Ananas comosus]